MLRFQGGSCLCSGSRTLGQGLESDRKSRLTFVLPPPLLLNIQKKRNIWKEAKYIYFCSLRAAFSTACFYVELNKMHLQT